MGAVPVKKPLDPSRVLRFDTYQIDTSRRRRQEDGALIVPGRLSRTGVQPYYDGIETINEYRPADEVFDAESIKSFEGLVVTDLHPPESMVTPENFRDYDRGHIQHVRPDSSMIDGETYLVADFYVHDADLISQIEDGKKTEISAGYFANLDFRSGKTKNGERYDAVQRNIRGNHVAMLPQGAARAGRMAKIFDSNAKILVNQDDNQPPAGGKESREMEFTIAVDGIPYVLQGDESAQRALEKERDRFSDLKQELDESRARSDAADEEITRLAQELADAQSPEKLNKAASIRADLIERAKKIADIEIGIVESERGIMLAALGDEMDLSGESDDYIRARFDAAVDFGSRKSEKSAEKLVAAMDSQQPTDTKYAHLREKRAQYIAAQRQRRAS